MTPYPVTTLADVFLYRLHTSNLPAEVNAGILSFTQLWGMAEAAAANLEPRLRAPAAGDDSRVTKDFACAILLAVDDLVRLGYVAKHTKDGGERLDRITLSTAGAAFISSVIFTDQAKAGQYTPRTAGPRRPARSYRRRGLPNYPTRY